MLEPLFDSAVKEKILLAVLARGESYPRELARIFGVPVYAVQYQLGNLEKGGVLYSRLRGRTRLYGFNPRYPFRKELVALLEKAQRFLHDRRAAAWFEPRLRPRRAGKPTVDMSGDALRARGFGFPGLRSSPANVDRRRLDRRCLCDLIHGERLSVVRPGFRPPRAIGSRRRINEAMESLGFRLRKRAFRSTRIPNTSSRSLPPPPSVGEDRSGATARPPRGAVFGWRC